MFLLQGLLFCRFFQQHCCDIWWAPPSTRPNVPAWRLNTCQELPKMVPHRCFGALRIAGAQPEHIEKKKMAHGVPIPCLKRTYNIGNLLTGKLQRSHSYLEEELLVGGPPLPNRLARPGPVRAPSPPSIKKREIPVYNEVSNTLLSELHFWGLIQAWLFTCIERGMCNVPKRVLCVNITALLRDRGLLVLMQFLPGSWCI